MSQKQALSIDEACTALGGIKRDLVYDLINSGVLRSVKLGRRRVIPSDAITECLKRNEVAKGGVR